METRRKREEMNYELRFLSLTKDELSIMNSSLLYVLLCVKTISFLSYFSLLRIPSEFSAQKKVSSQRFKVPPWWTKKESGENPELYLQL
jgi:hypothetical protein